MIPSLWQFVLLTLAVYRLWRLAAIDDMPWLVTARNRLVGAQLTAGVWTFRRPALAHMIGCPWCLGWWFTLAATAAWWGAPHATLVAAIPFAAATVVGGLGHHLNPE